MRTLAGCIARRQTVSAHAAGELRQTTHDEHVLGSDVDVWAQCNLVSNVTIRVKEGCHDPEHGLT